MFHETLLKLYFMKHSERKISVYPCLYSKLTPDVSTSECYHAPIVVPNILNQLYSIFSVLLTTFFQLSNCVVLNLSIM